MKTYLFSIAKVPSSSLFEEDSGFELDGFYQCKSNYDIPELIGIPVKECDFHPVHMVESYKEDQNAASLMKLRSNITSSVLDGVFFIKSEIDLTRENLELYLDSQSKEWLKEFFTNPRNKI